MVHVIKPRREIKDTGWTGYVRRTPEQWHRAAYADGPPPIGAEGAKRLGRILSKAAGSGSLSDWELEFVLNLDERYAKYGARTWISDRQRGALERIAQKLGMR